MTYLLLVAMLFQNYSICKTMPFRLKNVMESLGQTSPSVKYYVGVVLSEYFILWIRTIFRRLLGSHDRAIMAVSSV